MNRGWIPIAIRHSQICKVTGIEAPARDIQALNIANACCGASNLERSEEKLSVAIAYPKPPDRSTETTIMKLRHRSTVHQSPSGIPCEPAAEIRAQPGTVPHVHARAEAN